MQKQQPVRSATHKALFDNTLPFRGRREVLKTQYKRKPKHSKRSWE
jgi:hypothetical protein